MWSDLMVIVYAILFNVVRLTGYGLFHPVFVVRLTRYSLCYPVLCGPTNCLQLMPSCFFVIRLDGYGLCHPVFLSNVTK